MGVTPELDPYEAIVQAIGRPAWMDEAACRRVETRLFFGSTWVKAKAVCARCPVREACFRYALDNDLQGVWGGYTEGERESIRRSVAAAS